MCFLYLIFLCVFLFDMTFSDPIAPKIQPIISLKNVISGSSARVMCSVESGSAPLHFSWMFNEKLIQNQPGLNIKQLGDAFSTLELSPVSTIHSGKYSCEAINSVGNDAAHFEIMVKGIKQR